MKQCEGEVSEDCEMGESDDAIGKRAWQGWIWLKEVPSLFGRLSHQYLGT